MGLTDTQLALAAILVPLTAALLAPLADLISVRLRGVFSVAAAGLTAACLAALAPRVLAGNLVVYWMSGWTPRAGLGIGISLVVDAWGLLIAGIAAGVGFMALLYSLAYLQHETGRGAFYVLFLLLIAALIGFALSGDLFNQFVWLEVFSVAAFALTGYHYEERTALEAAFKYLVTNSIATLFIAIALCLLYMQTGALNLAQIARDLPSTPASVIALGLLVAGYATKAALLPWHFWLPDAHTAAPGPVSAIFSGALIKVGLYAIARDMFTLAPGLAAGPLREALLVIAAASILVGGLQMLQQQSLKRILAFSSVAQMGYVALGLALGTPAGLAAAALHLMHHALVKTALFMSAGLLTLKLNLHTLSEGGGLARRLPVTTLLVCLSALALSGLPLFSGYISKTMLEEAALASDRAWVAVIAVLGSLFTFTGMARAVYHLFFAPPRAPDARPDLREFEPLALLPIGLLVAASLAVGMFPGRPVAEAAWPAARALLEADRYVAAVLDPAASPPAGAEWHAEPSPDPLDWRHWWPSAIVVAGGLGLAILLVRRRAVHGAWAVPIQWLSRGLRLWHSGIVNDYALWTTVGTTLLVAALVVAHVWG